MRLASAFRKRLFAARQAWQLYLLLLPAVAVVLVFSYVPMYGVQIAFKDFRAGKGIWGSPWVGLKHIERFVNYPYFPQILRNTFVLSAYGLLAGTPLPILFALMLNEVGRAGYKKAVQMISYAPHFLSTVVVCGMLKIFSGAESGLFNNLGALFGKTRINLLGSAAMFPHLYVWSGIWQGLGWSAIIYVAALSGVSIEQVEAAYIDGANLLQTIWHVKLPAIASTIVILMILSSGGILSVGFEKAFLLQNPLNLSASEVISTYVYKVGLLDAQFSYSAAIGLFNTLFSVAVVCAVNALARKISDVSIF